MKHRKLCRILLGIPLALAGLLLASTIFHQLATVSEKKQHPPLGELVEVDGRQLHVYRRGAGDRTVVLLSGLGTPSPVHDFLPLVRELESTCSVVVIENFGYGWSDATRAERSSQAIIDEARTALRQLGLKPPYTLLPHSIAGLYTLYWANAHPEEISAVVGLDISNPAQIDFVPVQSGPNWGGLLRQTGIVRLALAVAPGLLPRYADETEADAAGGRMLTGWNLSNQTVWRETGRIHQNSLDLRDKTFPATIPVRLLISRETVDSVRQMFDGRDWLAIQQRLIAGHPDARLIVLAGDHYIHHGNAAAIRAILDELPGAP